MTNLSKKINALLEKRSVMTILNITPDSFYNKSRVGSDGVFDVCKKAIKEGATILDIGGYSSRPGADDVSPEEESSRVVPIIEQIRKEFPHVVISIDTFRKDVAEACCEVGADIVNDITGGLGDEMMIPWIVSSRTPYVLMHMRGTPQTMQTLCDYSDIIKDIVLEVKDRIDLLKKSGVVVFFDPGFGFSKSLEQNYEILNRLDEFKTLECPVLIGVSRKSMIYKELKVTANESLNGTSVLNTIALQKGARILRVHDTIEGKECIQLFEKTMTS